MRVEGPGGRSKAEELRRMQDITTLMTGGVVKVKKQRKERAKETGPRQQPERALRIEVVRELRKRGCKVLMIENSVYKNIGIPDLLVFNKRKQMAAWMELKSETGRLAPEQIDFKEHCFFCGMNWFEIRSVKEALEVIK